MIKILVLVSASGICLTNILLLPEFIVKIREALASKYLFLKYPLECNICFSFWINFLWNLFLIGKEVPFTYIIGSSSISTIISIIIYLYIINRGLYGK